MGQFKLPTGLCFVLCTMLLWASGVSAQVPGHSVSDLTREHQAPPPMSYEFCRATQGGVAGEPVTAYYSDVFGGLPPALQNADKAFVQFLEQKYSFKSSGNITSDVICQNVATEAQTRTNRQSWIDQSRSSPYITKVVETGWVFSAAGAASTTTSAPASGTSASAAQANDPRLAQLSPEDRKFVLDEIPGSKNYCLQNMELPLVFDCDCFAQMVFDYRVTHPTPRHESHRVSDLVAGRPAPPEPFSNILPKLDCSKCISEERITKWVTALIAKGGGWSDAQLQATRACTAHTLISDLRANPEMGEPQVRYGRALQTCIKSGGAASAPAPAAATAASAPPPAASAPAPASANTMPLTTARTSSPTSSAQVAPAPGTTVEVRIVETVDSSRDPAGKQYRATVTQAVNAGNNVNIPQGAIATVTLARNGTGWVAQLSSLTINGQPVTVSSSSATVTNTAQNAASTVSNTVGGIFGRKPNVPSTAQPVATGDRVILPPGSRVNFVLAATP